MGMAEDNLSFALYLESSLPPLHVLTLGVPRDSPSCIQGQVALTWNSLIDSWVPRVSSCWCQCFYAPNAPKVLSLTCCVCVWGWGGNQVTRCVRTMSTIVPDLWMGIWRGHLCLKIKTTQSMLSDTAHAPCILVILGLFEFSCISDNWNCPRLIPG